MVNRIPLLLSALCLSATGHCASLQIELDENLVEMGKSMTARVIYEGEVDPGVADLHQWQDDFVVDRHDRETESLISGQLRTTEHIRLYPRASGEKTLEAIALGGAFAYPVTIDVQAAIRDGIDGTPRWLSLPTRVWQGETIELAVELALFHPSNHIDVDEFSIPGFVMAGASRTVETREGISYVQLNWRLIALHKDVNRLDLPAIEQRGRGRWRFYLPYVEVQSMPLPGYLPATVPVGQIGLSGEVDTSGSDPVWQLRLHSDGRLPDEVYGIRTRLSVLTGQHTRSVEVMNSDNDNESDGRFVQVYRVPVPDWSLGMFSAPKITVRYFDPEDGRLKVISEKLPAVWRVPDAVRYLLWLLSGLVVLLILTLLVQLVKRYYSWRHYQMLLTQAKDAHALRRTLLQAAGSSTLGDWAARCSNGHISHLTEQLNQLCFSSSCNVDLTEVSQAASVHYSFMRWIREVERLVLLQR